MCSNCKHVQLKEIVSAERLFREYKYRSGTSTSLVGHFERLAETIKKIVKPSATIIEVGSNDGTLLRAFRLAGLKAVGIEPGEDLAAETKNQGLNVVCGLFDELTLKTSLNPGEQIDLIVGNNVFAHIDKIKEAFALVEKTLTSDGIFIFEVSHLLKVVNKSLFDTIYHEHMSYHTVLSLIPNLEATGLRVLKVEEIEMHGGSIRVYAGKIDTPYVFEDQQSVIEIVAAERNAYLDSPKFMEKFNSSIQISKNQANDYLESIQSKYSFVGFGAPAKLVTFISEFELERFDIKYVVDDNPDKQGKFTPGSALEVVSPAVLFHSNEVKERAIIIFPWNLREEIVSRLSSQLTPGTLLVWLLPVVGSVSI